MAASDVTFGVLGPLEVRVEGREIAPPGKIARRLLAALLLSADQHIDDDQLAAWTWGPRRVSRGALHTAAYRLRSWLADEAGPTVALVHGVAGYRLEVSAEYVDAGRFRHLARRTSDRTDGTDRVGNLEDALALWRGPVLADLPEWTREHPEVAALERERVAALCSLADAAAVASPPPSEATLRQVERLADELPYDETVQARWLMLLAACGRRADALRHYESVRARLADDLGVDPSAVLRDTHLALLTDEAPATSTPAATGAPPRTLPRGVADFTGRSDDIDRLLELATDTSTGRIITIDGMAGVGKTTTAVHAADRLTSHYPDGSLFVDLHGYTAGHEPADPTAALSILLRAVGVRGERIPDDLEDRAALWRSELTERRLIVVLDNAVSASQVRPLLPGPTPSLTLVTSRRRLTGLDDVEVVSLAPFDSDAAAELFMSIVGRRACAEPPAVRNIVAACGHLPLAIRIAAARLLHRPTWSVSDLEARLEDEGRRLGELTAEDRSVSTAFTLSYRELTPEQQRSFRLLGLLPGRDLDTQAAAVLLNLSVDAAARRLDAFVDSHLLEEPTPGRFRFHDLVHQQATALASDEPGKDRDEAVRRLLDHYLRAAEGAANLLEPIRLRSDPRDVPAPSWWRPPSNVAEAVTWLTTEFDNVAAAAHRAGAEGLSTQAWQLVQAVTALCRHRGLFSEGIALHEFAATMARQQGDQLREAITHQYLAGTYWAHGRTKEAFVHCQTSISLYRAIGDHDREMRARGNLGALHELLGDYPAALQCYRDSLSSDRTSGDARGQAIGLIHIGNTLNKLGDHQSALQHQRQALELLHNLDDPWVEAAAHCDLASVLQSGGSFEEAKSEYEAALSRLEAASDPRIEGICVGGLGAVLTHLGQPAEGMRLCERGVAMLRERDAKAALATLLNDLGHLHANSVDTVRSEATFQEAFDLARDVADPYEEARALEGLGDVSNYTGSRKTALDRWQRAQRIFDSLGVPDADRVARRLTETVG